MGNANASRPDNLPPSQGGRYAGFGSSPEPQDGPSSSHPSFGLSSHAAPTLDEFQRNPLGALSKGWGLFSSAVASSAREINESVVKPGVARAADVAHNVSTGEGNDQWRSYLNSGLANAKAAAGVVAQKAGEGWEGVNHLAKEKGGVDLNEQLGRLGIHGSGSGAGGYTSAQRAENGSAGKDDDFFESWDSQPAPASAASQPGSIGTNVASKQPAGPAGGAKPAKKDDDWQEW